MPDGSLIFFDGTRRFSMRTLGITLALTFAVTALAQQPAAMKLYSSSADVQALIAKSKSDKKEGQALVTQRILALAPYNANLEYRTAVANAAVHEKEAEMFYVIDGSGTLVTGGKLTEEKRTNADNLSGAGIEGGDVKNIAKGDFVMVPAGSPHWFSKINGSLVLMSIHLPKQ
jgi:mannose-6-phosphate isomerase-like protein (cupin superfamily)